MNHKDLALHLLYHLSRAQLEGRRLDLPQLVELVGVRRGDIRSTLSTLHRQGLYDVVRSRPTLIGFTIGRRQVLDKLPVLRPAAKAQCAAA